MATNNTPAQVEAVVCLINHRATDVADEVELFSMIFGPVMS